MPETPSPTHSFQASRMQELGFECIYQSITIMPHHSRFSFEELRLNDYQPQVAGLPLGVVSVDFNKIPAGDFAFPMRPSPSRRLRFDGGVIVFRVGSGPTKDFTIHENVVKPSSIFVQISMNKGWKEAQDRMVPLPDDDPGIFAVYQTWLYEHVICTEPAHEENRVLVKAYILGEKFQDFRFKNAVIGAIIRRLKETSKYDLRLTNLVYDNTPESSRLRLLLRDIYLWFADSSWLDETKLEEPIHGDFLRDLNRDQFDLRRSFCRLAPAFRTCAVSDRYLETESQ